MPPFVGISSNDLTRNIEYDNLQVIGFHWGIDVPVMGSTLINGGYYDNQQDFAIRTARGNNRNVMINGPIGFGTRTIYQVQMYPQIGPLSGFFYDVSHDFLPDTVVANYGSFVNRRLYYDEQQADFIPFPVADIYVPPAYVGLTNQQLHDHFGISIGGAIAAGKCAICGRYRWTCRCCDPLVRSERASTRLEPRAGASGWPAKTRISAEPRRKRQLPPAFPRFAFGRDAKHG